MEYFIALNQFFRRWQRQNRSVGENRLAEAHFLVELESDPSRSARFLGDLLGLEQSSISRMIQRLVKKGLIRTRVSTEDRRRRNLQLTAKGKRLIKEIDKNANARLEELSAGITRRELEQLNRFMQRIADGFDHPRAAFRTSDHPLRAEQRRATRCLGLLGRKALGSNLSSTAWHLLSEICESEQGVLASELSEILFLPPNTTSASLSSLEREGLIKRTNLAKDLRKVIIVPTRQGRTNLKKIQDSAAKLLQQSMSDFSQEELHRLMQILEKFTGANEIYIRGDIRVRIVKEESERSAARSFLLENLVKLGFQGHAPIELVGPTATIVGLYSRGKLRGLGQFSSSPSHPQLNSLVWAPALAKDELIKRFLTAALRLYFNQTRLREIELSFPPINQLAEKTVKIERKQGRLWITRPALFGLKT